MSRKNYRTDDFIKVIPGSGGIISAIAKRVGCDWHTANKWIQEHPTVKQAFEDERESMLDMAEGVLFGNIRFAAKEQQDASKRNETVFVDTGDAKWVLSRMGKERGYSEKIHTEITGKDDGPIQTSNILTIIDYGNET